MKRLLPIICLLLCLVFACKSTKKNAEIPVFQTRGVTGEKAMVVTAHKEASKVGINILKKGGNAIDAAIGVHLALAVTYPQAGNLGGGGFMVIRLTDGTTKTLDFREMAPSLAHRDLFLDKDGNVIPRLSLDGHLAAGVPGSVDGCVSAHDKYGSLPWKDLVQPAVDLAQQGFRLSEIQAERFQSMKADFDRLNPDNDYLIKKGGWKAGDLIQQVDLAQTLTRIRDKGRAGFYEGETADLIVAEMKSGDGIISKEDLKNYTSIWRAPLISSYKEYDIISMAPPSSGGIALIQLLKMVEPLPVKKWGYVQAETVHSMTEAERRVYADRASHLGDPDFYEVPVEGLLDEAYLKDRMSSFNSNTATPSSEISAGKPTAESPQTTHYSIVDPFGNAVSVTTTINGSFGAKTFVSGAGFLLNNEMDDFSSKPGVPNVYGLIGGTANAIEPAKRMLSSMTPTIIEKEDQLFMVLGTPGGSTIITSVFQTFLNVVEHSMTMHEAANAPRFHHQWRPDTLFVEEKTLSEPVRNQLTKMGHTVVERSAIGRMDAILVLPDGRLEGGADRRGEDTAIGF